MHMLLTTAYAHCSPYTSTAHATDPAYTPVQEFTVTQCSQLSDTQILWPFSRRLSRKTRMHSAPSVELPDISCNIPHMSLALAAYIIFLLPLQYRVSSSSPSSPAGMQSRPECSPRFLHSFCRMCSAVGNIVPAPDFDDFHPSPPLRDIALLRSPPHGLQTILEQSGVSHLLHYVRRKYNVPWYLLQSHPFH